MADTMMLATNQTGEVDVDQQADDYAAEYVMTTEGNDYVPTEWERELIIDALHGFIADHWNASVATQPATSQEGGGAHLQTIDERDALHEALSAAYRAVCGVEPAWSNLFGYNDALDDIREAVAVAPIEPVKEDWRKALQPFADCVEQIDPAESDDEWAKFRLTIGDYRRAALALAATPKPPTSEDLRVLREALEQIDRINGGADWNGTRTIARAALGHAKVEDS